MKISKVNFNNQKGFSTAEIAISVVIIMIVLNVILMIYTNLNINMKNLERKSIASKISIDILENANMTYFDNIDNILNNYNKNENDEYVFEGDNNIEIFSTKIPAGYTVYINVINTELDENLKQINVRTEYMLYGNKQSMVYSKVIERENISY